MADLSPGSTFAGHRIDGVAGKGGMGVVYRATDLHLDRPVALKLVGAELAEDPAFAERFKRESRLAASLDHPNVIPIYHAGEEDGRLYVTMRFVEGTDLAELLRRDRRLAPARAVQIAAQVGAALDAAHARGLVHRDVKPANILLQGDHVFLTDFGLSKQVDSGDDLTETGAVLGTVDYMAPEQVQGGVVDARSDVYALGCVLFQMLSGRVPFERPNGVAKLFAHVSEPAPRLKDVPDALADVVARAMEKDPGRRYQSAGELAGAAAHAIGTSPSALRPTPPASRVGEGTARGRRRWLWAAGAAALAAVAVAVVLLLGGSGSSSNEDKAELTTLIRHLISGSNPADCPRIYTAHYLTTYYGRPFKDALQACVNESSGGSGPAQPVVIRQLQVQGNVASAQTHIVGQPITFTFVKSNGQWRVDNFTETPKGRFTREVSAVITSSYKNEAVLDQFLFGKLPMKSADGVPATTAQYLDGAVKRLEGLTAPAGLSDVLQHLVTTLRAVQASAHAAADAKAAHDATAYAAAERKLGPSIKQFGAAEAELARAQ